MLEAEISAHGQNPTRCGLWQVSEPVLDSASTAFSRSPPANSRDTPANHPQTFERWAAERGELSSILERMLRRNPLAALNLKKTMDQEGDVSVPRLKSVTKVDALQLEEAEDEETCKVSEEPGWGGKAPLCPGWASRCLFPNEWLAGGSLTLHGVGGCLRTQSS